MRANAATATTIAGTIIGVIGAIITLIWVIISYGIPFVLDNTLIENALFLVGAGGALSLIGWTLFRGLDE